MTVAPSGLKANCAGKGPLTVNDIAGHGGVEGMAIEWTKDLETGVALIDEQHKELFDRVNKLLAASSQGRGKEEVGSLLGFLEE